MKSPKRIADNHRPRHVAAVHSSGLRERERALARAAEVTNRSREVRAIEKEFDNLGTEILEPWDEAPSKLGGTNN